MRATRRASEALPLSLAALAAVSLALPTEAAAQRVMELHFTPTDRAQIAIWVADAEGTYLRTLGLTEAVARRGIGNRPGAAQMNSGFRWPYGRREGVLPVWAHARAGAPGAALFRRVIFQDRLSEGHASRSTNDSSRDDYFCLSFDTSTTTRDALDAVTCASVFNSDKGRYLREEDVTRGYFEPQEVEPGVMARHMLDLFSLYPPRRDVTGCGPGCIDTLDAASYSDDARAVLPEIDAVSMATPAGSVPWSTSFTWPETWPDGRYAVFVEVNVEGDWNEAWGPTEYPTPRNPAPGTPEYGEYWDYWAMNYGYPYRGQPSIVYRLDVEVGPGDMQVSAATPVGYGSLTGTGDDGGELRPIDATITDDPSGAPGSGADRLHLVDGARVSARVLGPGACDGNGAPAAPSALSITQYASRHDAHRFAHVSFVVPADDRGVTRYEMRVASHPIVDEASFLAATPAKAATTEGEGLVIPVDAAPGEEVSLDLGGLVFETHYWVGLRAIDRCNASSPIAVAEYTTPAIEFTTVSPCFVATAAYGTPLADEIGALRRFRDRHLEESPLGALLVDAYEAVGPHVAAFVREDEGRREVARALLAPIVRAAEWLDAD